MAVDGVSVSTSSKDTSSAASKQTLAKDLDTFLYLLTSQLKNQDPLSPMDTTEFTNQLVQFATVEQNIYMNENLEKLISLNASNLATNAMSYLGHTVQADSNIVPLQEGYGKFSYILPQEAKSVSVVITDADGKIVYSTPGETAAGRHILDWDGVGNDGRQREDGAYKVSITALDEEGGQIADVATTVFGRVTGIASDGNDIAVAIGGAVLPMEKILAVHEEEKPDPVEIVDNTDPDDTDTTDETATP